MAPDNDRHRRRHSRPPPTSKPARSRYAAEREERKEHGTPEKKKSPRRKDRDRDRSPERETKTERISQKRTRSPERTPQKRTRSPERRNRREEIVVEYERSPERRPRAEETVVEYEAAGESEVESEESIPPPTERAPKKHTPRRKGSAERKSRSKSVIQEKHESYDSISTTGSTRPLSLGALAQLDAINEKRGDHGVVREREKKERQYSEKRTIKEKVVTGRIDKGGGSGKVKHRRRDDGRSERRRVSGPLLEEGRGERRRRVGYVSADEIDEDERRRWFPKKKWIALVLLLLVIAIVVVAVVVSKKKTSSGGGSAAASGSGNDPSNNNLNGVNEDAIPTTAKNTILDPFTWYDTTDFNVTYTNVTVGGLPIMGLNSTWNDTTQANQYVPPLDKSWQYGQMPIRGVNIGGWLSIEPFITPSLFNTYKPNQGIVDEWTLSKQLGPQQAAKTIEKHYSQFITEADFAAIQAAGFDHVRIPYSYWAVTTYPGDPYVPKISWRYLLRGIEYARKYGLRVNLDLHGLPGSQNGWNHSGRQGSIGWLNGTDGALNAQRSLDLHTQLATFFAQPRYQNVIAIYGLVNEPKMTELPVPDVVNWTTVATGVVRKSGMNQTVAFGDGFLGLTKWQGQMQGVEGLVLDAHEYVIFDANLIAFNHSAKAGYACTGWTSQMKQSLDKTTGYAAKSPHVFPHELTFSSSTASAPPSAANGPKPTQTAPPISTTSAPAPAGKAHSNQPTAPPPSSLPPAPPNPPPAPAALPTPTHPRTPTFTSSGS